jgi:hypothetical protein
MTSRTMWRATSFAPHVVLIEDEQGNLGALHLSEDGLRRLLIEMPASFVYQAVEDRLAVRVAEEMVRAREDREDARE